MDCCQLIRKETKMDGMHLKQKTGCPLVYQ